MNKAELVQELASRSFGGNRAEAARALDAVVDVITDEMGRHGKVSISGFGVFEVVHRDARVVRNPRTGARKSVDAYDLPRFRPGTRMLRAVQNPES